MAVCFISACSSSGYYNADVAAKKPFDSSVNSLKRLKKGEGLSIDDEVYIVQQTYFSALAQSCAILSISGIQQANVRACYSGDMQTWRLIPKLIING